MSGSTESVSPQPTEVLIVGLNWLGDAIMSMPAIQLFREAHPDWRITMLVKPPLAPIWQMHAGVDVVEILEPGNRGVYTTARHLTGEMFQQAYILPNSFRSAFIPWLGGIRKRIGVRGQYRGFSINEPVDLSPDLEGQHQQYEMLAVLGLDLPAEGMPMPALEIPGPELLRAAGMLPIGTSSCIGLIPGAARGPSKQWPEDHFARLANRVLAESPARVALLGTPDDQALCARILEQAKDPERIVNLAGATDLNVFTALLSCLDAVVANDSGGMHLAAATGTPVIALYGITDPAKTGPLGPHCTVLQKSETRSRDIPRVSAEAEAALASITPDEVWDVLKGIITS